MYSVSSSSPIIICVSCDEFLYAPYPEPEHWYNPDQSGTGYNLEIQYGIMAGYYYGYNNEGVE